MPEFSGHLSQERIVDAAVRLVDQEGLAALTMRRLGRELGVEGMSLYTYFPNKAALLFALVKRLIDEIRPVHAPDADWQERLRAVMRSFREVGLAHPSIFALMMTRPWDGYALARMNEDLGTLRGAGFTAEEAGHVLSTLIGFATGFVMKEIRGKVRESFGTPDPDARAAARSRLAAYPYLLASRRYLSGHAPHSARAFEAGLDLICAGAGLLLARRSDTADVALQPAPADDGGPSPSRRQALQSAAPPPR